MKKNITRIAIQKEGRLRNESFALLAQFGISLPSENDRNLIARSEDGTLEVLLVRHSDIPQFVESGAADFGIVGKNILEERIHKIKTVRSLSTSHRTVSTRQSCHSWGPSGESSQCRKPAACFRSDSAEICHLIDRSLLGVGSNRKFITMGC